MRPREASTHDLYWLAGLLEGEGSFLPGSPSAPHRPTIQIVMIDEDVMARVGHLVGRKVITCKARRPEWLPTYAIRIRGAEAVAWMRALRPVLGRRRQMQVERALRTYAPKSRQRLYDKSALEALMLLEAGASVRSVADRFGVSVWCIYDLCLGRTHRHLRPSTTSVVA